MLGLRQTRTPALNVPKYLEARPWTARLVLAGYVLLATSGLVLQWRSGSTFADLGYPFLIAASLLVAIWASIGVLIIQRHPRHPIGWIMLLAHIAWGPDSFSFGYLSALEAYPSASQSLTAVLRLWLAWTGFPFSIFGFTLLFLLFPTGAPLSPRWGRLAPFALGALGCYLVLTPLNPVSVLGIPVGFARSPIAIGGSAWLRLQPLWWAVLAAMFLCLLAAAPSLLARFRRSRGEERLQLKWFLLGAAIFPISVPPTAYSTATGSAGIVLSVAVSVLFVSFSAIALAIAVAMFRYRLYDIDLIINRTLVYGPVTGLLALTYLITVFALQSALRATMGQQSQLAIVASTLFIAALFHPLRRRVQNVIDRRFYRRKYVAAQLLDRFGVRLQDEVDQELVSALLLELVAEWLQPTSASLWLRRGRDRYRL